MHSDDGERLSDLLLQVADLKTCLTAYELKTGKTTGNLRSRLAKLRAEILKAFTDKNPTKEEESVLVGKISNLGTVLSDLICVNHVKNGRNDNSGDNYSVYRLSHGSRKSRKESKDDDDDDEAEKEKKRQREELAKTKHRKHSKKHHQKNMDDEGKKKQSEPPKDAESPKRNVKEGENKNANTENVKGKENSDNTKKEEKKVNEENKKVNEENKKDVNDGDKKNAKKCCTGNKTTSINEDGESKRHSQDSAGHREDNTDRKREKGERRVTYDCGNRRESENSTKSNRDEPKCRRDSCNSRRSHFKKDCPQQSKRRSSSRIRKQASILITKGKNFISCSPTAKDCERINRKHKERYCQYKRNTKRDWWDQEPRKPKEENEKKPRNEDRKSLKEQNSEKEDTPKEKSSKESKPEISEKPSKAAEGNSNMVNAATSYEHFYIAPPADVGKKVNSDPARTNAKLLSKEWRYQDWEEIVKKNRAKENEVKKKKQKYVT